MNSQDRCSSSSAAERARLMMGCFRAGDATDPQIYATAVVAVLCGYPEQVVRRVTDPVMGLPSKIKWMPTIAEVKEACEAEMAPVYRAQRQQQIAAEERTKQIAPPLDPEEIRERAVERWERQKAEAGLKAKVDSEAARVAAEKRLGEMYRETQSAEPVVVPVGAELAAKIHAMATAKSIEPHNYD